MSFSKKIINENQTINLQEYSGEDLKCESFDIGDISLLDSTSDKIRICFVDTETTGVHKEKDHIIEIALKCIEIDKHDGKNLKVLASYESLQDPGIPIPPESMKIHEITDDDVKGHAINWNEVDDIFKFSQLIVAHNAGFDRPFIERHSIVSQKKIWACSVNDIDWMERGFKNKKQELLCIWHGFYYGSHRAMTDVDALIHLVANPLYETDKPVVELVKNARNSWVKVYAYNSKISDKDLLKERFYRWDPNKRVWHKIIESDKRDEERDWLCDKIYDGNFMGQILEVLPVDKYKL